MKKCFKCGKLKPLSDFYPHPQMADGHVNKCKECNKNDVRENYQVKILEPGFIEKERKRARLKYVRLYVGMGVSNPEGNKRWLKKYPEKRLAHLRAQRIKVKGKQNHHWSYNQRDWYDVIHLTTKEHGKVHRFLIYDQERMMYRRYDTNELLDTKAKHKTFILHCIKHKED